MNSDNKFKKIDIKNYTCYYFDDIININDLNLDNILIDGKSYENILIYNAANKTSYGEKTLRINFDKVDRYSRTYDSAKYLALFDTNEKGEIICDSIKYLIMLKSNISDMYSHKYTKNKTNSDDDLPLEKIYVKFSNT